MHRTKHLTKPRLGERLGGVAPNQDTKKQPISNQEGPWTQWPKAVMARVRIIAPSHYSWSRDKRVGGELKKPVLFGKQ